MHHNSLFRLTKYLERILLFNINKRNNRPRKMTPQSLLQYFPYYLTYLIQSPLHFSKWTMKSYLEIALMFVLLNLIHGVSIVILALGSCRELNMNCRSEGRLTDMMLYPKKTYTRYQEFTCLLIMNTIIIQYTSSLNRVSLSKMTGKCPYLHSKASCDWL